MGATTYGLLRNLVQPHTTKDKTFEGMVTVLKEHLLAAGRRLARPSRENTESIFHKEKLAIHIERLCPLVNQSIIPSKIRKAAL